MTENPLFRGAGTALITPMTPAGVDYDSFGRLIDWQVESGTDALIIAGTTGEGSTLDDAEHISVVKYAVERTAGRVPVIAGTGSNDTNYAVHLTKACCEVGCDGVLVVTPYYNKATQRGLVEMFNVIADASTVPVILYNIPSRTGVAIKPRTYLQLSEHPRIRGIKEANGDIGALVETMSLVGDKMDVYSGNDDQIVPFLSMGAAGVISVLANPMPAQTHDLCQRFFDGDVAGAAALQCTYQPLVRALFSEVNPIPVKAAMAAMGYCEDHLRLPLTPMERSDREVLLAEMRALGLIS